MAKKINYASLYTLRKDGRYQGSYTDEKGRHFVYDRDPERLYRKLHEAQEPKVMTFGEIAAQWENEHRESITVRTWSNYVPHYKEILHRHGGKTIDDVTALDIMNHLTSAKAQGYSATIVNSIRSLYRMIFDFAITHDYAKYNPVGAIKLPKGLKRGKRSAPTDEQIKIICANIETPFGLFPFFLLCTGLRKSEALALTWSDIDFSAKLIYITKSIDYTNGANPKFKTPKTEAGFRTVPIIEMLFPALKSAHSRRTSEYVFPSEDSNRSGKGGGLMTERGYEGAWLRYCRSVGLMDGEKPSITAHNLRHGTATIMFESGVDELTTQKILGHSRIEITRAIYTDLRAAQRAKSLEKFNDSLNKYMPDDVR